MILRVLELGSFAANCYIAACAETKEGVIIDPGAEGKQILRVIEDEEIKIKYIINTHGHIDHVGANAEVKESTGAPLLIHRDDGDMCRKPHASLSIFAGKAKLSEPDRLLEEGDIIEVGKLKFEVLHTPGHTRGGISLKAENTIFSGDTLFRESIGRTDLPGGSYRQIISSIKEKILPYPDDTLIYPGHGPATTVGEEKATNPFLK